MNPDLAEAHVGMGRVHLARDEMKQSETEVRRAIELNPSIPEAYNTLSDILILKGEIKEGYRVAENFYLLDPVNPSYAGNMGMMLFYQGKESEALEHWNKTSDIAPFHTHRFMTEFWITKNDFAKAEEHFSAAKKLRPSSSWVGWMGGFLAAKKGDRDGAINAVREIEITSKVPIRLKPDRQYQICFGDLDSYFELLNRSFDQHGFDYLYPVLCPLFAEARTYPRYHDLIERMRESLWPKRS